MHTHTHTLEGSLMQIYMRTHNNLGAEASMLAGRARLCNYRRFWVFFLVLLDEQTTQNTSTYVHPSCQRSLPVHSLVLVELCRLFKWNLKYADCHIYTNVTAPRSYIHTSASVCVCLSVCVCAHNPTMCSESRAWYKNGGQYRQQAGRGLW
jgi:hypothetical protein